MTAAYEAWSALAGRELRATDEAGVERSLLLAEVSAERVGGGWTGYTLGFRAGPGFPAEQQTYRLSGDGVDEPVFVVPVGREGDGIALEAVFALPYDEEER